MIIAVLNRSGNAGKTTIATQLLMPRMPAAELITIESINADDGADDLLIGRQYDEIAVRMMVAENAVLDIGASNIESFMGQLRRHAKSAVNIDLFLVPTTKVHKVQRDTIRTIQDLVDLDVPPRNISVIFNMLEEGDTLDDDFYMIKNFYDDEKMFRFNPDAQIWMSDIYRKLAARRQTVEGVLSDKRDWRDEIRKARLAGKMDEAKDHADSMVVFQAATGVKENLDRVFAAIMAAGAPRKAA
jgi:hypothetical protein